MEAYHRESLRFAVSSLALGCREMPRRIGQQWGLAKLYDLIYVCPNSAAYTKVEGAGICER
jgi:hypothetical protein